MNGLFVAASGAASQLDALDISTHNLANGGTPGFRRFELAAQAVEQGSSPYQYAAVEAAAPTLDMSQGPVRNTGNPLDVAVVGPAFIRVQTANGEAYTRNGQMEVSPDGTLLAAGQPVLGDGGGTITLQAGTVAIALDGSISVNSQPIGRIGMADPTGATLNPAGSSLYATADGEPLPAATTSQLRQGYVEQSGSDPIAGVFDVMRIMRGYESAINAVHAIDESQDRTIQALTLQA
ncbi:MAG: flagellar hook basal-body protein [Candidatus Binataceae bacterium]|jgi:flagellar basal body rod protein FlgG